jgi:hypothetical protein
LSFILYLAGVVGLLLAAAMGAWRAYWLCAALIVCSTTFVCLYPFFFPGGPESSASGMAAFGAMIMSPWLLGGAIVAGGLSYMIAAFTARRREEAEIAALLADEDGQ